MRIAWFHSHLLNLESGGTRFVFDLIETMKNRYGHDFTIYCDVASPESRRRAQSIGIPLVTLDSSSTNSPLYWLTLAPRVMVKRMRLRREIAAFEVAITSMFPMNWILDALEIPKIQICYEPFAFFYDAKFTSTLKWHERVFFRIAAKLYSRSDRHSARNMTRTVTINATNVAKIRNVYGIDARVVYAGVDTSLFSTRAPSEAAPLRERHHGEPLLFHSTDLSGTKGTIPFLLVFKELLEKFPCARLLITVYVKNVAGVRALKRRIAELGLGSSVDVLGCLSREELPLYYNAVDIVCQPSLDQPASWPLRESLMCGTPIVGGMESEEVIEGINGARIDVTQRVQSVERLEALFQQFHTLEPSASGTVIRETFSRERCAADFQDVLNSSQKTTAR